MQNSDLFLVDPAPQVVKSANHRFDRQKTGTVQQRAEDLGEDAAAEQCDNSASRSSGVIANARA